MTVVRRLARERKKAQKEPAMPAPEMRIEGLNVVRKWKIEVQI